MQVTAHPLRLTPPWREAEQPCPVYLARIATLDERTLFEAELAAPPWNAGKVYDFQLMEQLRAFVDSLYPDEGEDRARILEVLHLALASPAAMDEAGRQLLLHLEEAASQQWAGYAALRGARARRAAIVGPRALRRFLTGWEGVDAPFQRGGDGLPTDETLRQIPEHERVWLGAMISNALFLQEPEKKASGSPPPSPPAPEISAAARSRQTAGRAGTSAAKSSRGTPR
jgi:hypothetical protein